MLLANFNITFGVNNEPLLERFEDIFLPAITSGLEQIKKEDKYLLMNVRILEIEANEFILAGFIVKDTIVEVRSKNTDEGLIYTNESYPSAPFSIFVVFLKNHRAFLVKNQRESPGIGSLNTLIQFLLKRYTYNINVKKTKNEKLPYPLVNIVNLPSKTAIKDNLDRVEKIKELVLKVYPLNRDIPVNDILAGINEEIQDMGGSGASLIINSPTIKSKVVDFLSNAGGEVVPSMKVDYYGGGSGTLKNDKFSLTMDIEVPESDDVDKKIEGIAKYRNTIEEINETSPENLELYKSKLGMLQRLKSS